MLAAWLLCTTLLSPADAMDQLHKQPEALITPVIDGAMNRTEWARAGSVFATDEAPSGIEALFFGWDHAELFLALQHQEGTSTLTITIWRASRARDPVEFLARIEASPTGSQVQNAKGQKWNPKAWRDAHSGRISEYALPWQGLGARSGEILSLQVQTASGHFPDRPVSFSVP